MKDKLCAAWRKIIGFRLHVPWPAALAVLLVYTVVLTLLTFILLPGDWGVMWALIQESGFQTFLWNWLPVALVTFFLFFALGSMTLSAGIAGALFTALSIVNRFKILMRQDPLYLMDFTLATEVGSILINNFRPETLLLGVFAAVGTVAFVAVAACFVRTKRIPILARVIPALAIACFAVFANGQWLNKSVIYNGLPMRGNMYNPVDSCNSRGFVFSFMYWANTNQLRPPEGYSRSAYAALHEDRTEEQEEVLARKNPHVFFIMSEAFSELSDSDKLDFTGFDDPLVNFKRLREDAALYGHIIVPGLGGGTANTEFDALTGMNARFFRSASNVYRLVASDMNSIARQLGRAGYDNIAIHPGDSWFYNRQNVFRFFGFSGFIHLGDFPQDKDSLKGPFVSERVCFDVIIKLFEQHRERSDAPFLDFAVTIQNHGPYANRYGSAQNFTSDIPFAEEEIKELSNYFEGLADADRELQRLVDYAEASDEPIMIVFYGDHMPLMPVHIYEQLVDSAESDLTKMTNRYSVPYLIWQNSAQKAQSDLAEKTEGLGLPSHGRISSSYLYNIALYLLDMQHMDAYTEYGLEMLREYPIVLEESWFDTAGNLHTEGFNEALTKYKSWQYYRLADERK